MFRLFTSPHLVSLNERIRINHKNIPDHVIDTFLFKYKEAINSIKPSFFEIMTVMAMWYFKKNNVEKTIEVVRLLISIGLVILL